jgi:hypothetical protein
MTTAAPAGESGTSPMPGQDAAKAEAAAAVEKAKQAAMPKK